MANTAGMTMPFRGQKNWMLPSPGIGNIYTGAVNTQAGDYDKIMQNYQNLLNSAQNNAGEVKPLSFNPLTAQQNTFTPASYTRSDNLNNVMSQLGNLSTTGGYSESDISNIRARGVSPIRAVYANAMQNLARQKSLQGGYSPNYGALQAKMAREQSSILSDKTTDVNAQIAEMVGKGKVTGLNNLAQLSSHESDAINALNAANATGVNQTNLANTAAAADTDRFNQSMAAQLAQLNSGINNQNYNQQLAPIQGMQSLYGTTPALAATFGNQVLQAGNQNIAANQAVNKLPSIRRYGAGPRGY